MIKPNLNNVFSALKSGLDRLPLSTVGSDGEALTLTCSDVFRTLEQASDAQLPFLLLKTGPIKSEEWQPYVYIVHWTISAQLKIHGGGGDVDRVLQGVIEDIIGQLVKMSGLYVDKDSGVSIPFSDVALDLYRKGQLQKLAYRAGPILTQVTPRPVQPDTPYGQADMSIFVEFLDDKDPMPDLQGASIGYATLFSVGTIPRAADGHIPLADPFQDFRYSIPAPAPLADTRAQGRYSGMDYTPPDFFRDAPPFPPYPGKRIPSVAGVSDSDLVKEVTVSPATAIFAHTTTQQLTAIAYHLGGYGEQCSLTGTWASSDATKATVNASGLVTGVAAGTVTISCAYGGAAGSATLTLT